MHRHLIDCRRTAAVPRHSAESAPRAARRVLRRIGSCATFLANHFRNDFVFFLLASWDTYTREDLRTITSSEKKINDDSVTHGFNGSAQERTCASRDHPGPSRPRRQSDCDARCREKKIAGTHSFPPPLRLRSTMCARHAHIGCCMCLCVCAFGSSPSLGSRPPRGHG